MLFALVASVAVDRQLDLFDRLHARQRRAAPDLASTSASPSRSAARSASLSPRTCSRCSCSTRRLTLVDLSAGDAQGQRGGHPRRPHLSLLLLGTSLLLFLPAIIATWVLAGTLDFTPGGILAGKAGAPVIAAAARALRVRHRQGGADAAALLAAGGDGGADAGQRAAARRGGGQGRRVHGRQGRRLRVRDRRAGNDRRQRLARSSWRRRACSPRRSLRCRATI